MSRARSQILRAPEEKSNRWTNSLREKILRWISCCDSSQCAYFTQLTIFVRFFRMASSYSLRFFIRYSASSSGSLIFCRGGGATYSNCFSFASRNNCSAVIWTLKRRRNVTNRRTPRSTYGAGILFLTLENENEEEKFISPWRKRFSTYRNDLRSSGWTFVLHCSAFVLLSMELIGENLCVNKKIYNDKRREEFLLCWRYSLSLSLPHKATTSPSLTMSEKEEIWFIQRVILSACSRTQCKRTRWRRRRRREAFGRIRNE